ncbi:Rv3235 family protein [Streptomyces sp. V3I7]|uniref:Rv3235 family protein n=1 Tax=Streptomyces sp. V3I7 TaxID=3042278 RepID=UPI002780AB6E|nr:Rv3235 family protein [Streptomyces sp. V3I7]MDQ0991245.1 hypothetical protein [Streptomyces sp. V3I7]
MHKVMTRTASHARPGTRPPTRHDSRRPGGSTPRTATTRAAGAAGAGTAGTAGAGTAGTAGAGTAASARGAAPAPARAPRPTDLFADRLLAVLSGHRPVHWMLRHTAGRAYDELARLAERGPLRARGTRPVVRDIGYFVPRQGAIEAFARIGAGDQLRAMAFRLELGPDLRWRCTAVELGGPRPPREE